MKNVFAPLFQGSLLGHIAETVYIQTRWAKRRFSGLSHEPIDVSVAGTTATFHAHSAQEYHWITNIEKEEGIVIEDIVRELDDGDVFWDVGANIGLVSCLVGNAADVETIAFEPYPPSVRSLRENLSDNSLSDRSTVIESALGSEEGTADLNLATDWDTKHSLVNKSTDTIPVPVKQGDSIASELGFPDIVKIDVEGAEMGVISGMEAVIDHCRRIYCEVHCVYGVDEDSARDRFQSRGFTVKKMADDGKTASLVAEK